MNKYRIHAVLAAMVLLIMFTIIPSGINAQKKQKRFYFIELKVGVLSGFGSFGDQAELVGGVDTLWFDKKQHINTGFKISHPVTATVGAILDEDNAIQLQATLGYYSLDIGLGKAIGNDTKQLLIAQMMMFKVEVQGQYSNDNARRDNRFGLFYGVGISSTVPLYHKMNTTRTQEYGIDKFRSSMQLNWNIDFNLKVRLGKKGVYGIANAGLTMPGLVGSIGKLNVKPESSFTVEHSKVKMYYFTSSVGLGYYFNK
jgi:hypothetical protein